MIIRINRHKAAISSVILLGYTCFILISLTHFHPESFSGTGKTVDMIHNSSTKSAKESEENCPICQLASSISINTVSITISSNLVFESIFPLKDEPVFTSSIIQENSLRGPPEFNIHLV